MLITVVMSACSGASMGERTELARLEGPLRVEAQHALTLDGGICEPAPAALGGGTFGPFKEVCNIGFGTQPAVEFRRLGEAIVGGGQRTSGLVYHPTTTTYREIVTCMKHINGNWSEFSRPADPNCPSGYEYTGA